MAKSKFTQVFPESNLPFTMNIVVDGEPESVLYSCLVDWDQDKKELSVTRQALKRKKKNEASESETTSENQPE